jgi:UDP-glucose 4-epimerase
MRVFLTGGTGFIGSYVAIELLRQDHELTILARNPDKIPELKRVDRIEIVKGDVTDLDLLTELVQDKDACIHIALNYTRKRGREVLLDDTLPTVHLADAAVAAGVRHFIYTSSTAVNDSLYMGHDDEPQGGAVSRATATTKQRPATFYGATKAACENYLIADSFLSPIRVNIIRPGYTFGNPVVEGAPTQSDTRFRDIVRNALANRPINVIKNDGTQLIWAGNLAVLYAKLLQSGFNRKTYYGLGASFVSWESIAREAVTRVGSTSEIVVEDLGWSEDGLSWDVSDMKDDFGLEFDAWDKIIEHLNYYIHQENFTAKERA